MGDWVEAVAGELRDRTGGDIERLLVLLEPGITVWHDPDPPPLCVHWSDGGCDIFAPLRNRRQVLHECGHALLTVGLGRHLQAIGAPTARRQRLRDEAVANRFADRFDAEE
jgi:hypothetical protein